MSTMKIELDTMDDQHVAQSECAPRLSEADSPYKSSTHPFAVSELSILFFDSTATCLIQNCSKVFTTAKHFRSHRTKFHKMSPYYCVVCCAPFTNYNDLAEHQQREDHKIMCPVCPRRFFWKPVDATVHFINWHRQFLCNLCSGSFSGRYELRAHAMCCGQEKDSEDFVASTCVEISMSSSFSETNGQLTNHHESLEVSQQEPTEYFQPEISMANVDSNMTFQCVRQNSSETETADSDQVACESNIPLMEIASQSLRESFPDLEILNHCVLGSGSEDFPLDSYANAVSPNISTLSGLEEDDGQWIGHDVDMYQDISEKHKTTYKYTCQKCASFFKSEFLLKKHERSHEHACKYCPRQFNSLPEYRTHLKEHHVTDTLVSCSVCGHNCEGLKNLMIHEMHHRLNSAFKQELEIFATSSGEPTNDEFDCEICQDHIVGLSMWLRHKIWHRWVGMWTSYVLGRSFKGTFTVEDATRLKHVVEAELALKWRDCLINRKVLTKQKVTDKPEEHDPGTNSTANQNDDCNVLNDDVSTIPNSVHEKEDEFQDESDSEGVRHAINSWMSYWQSYLGLDENPPSWIKPILSDLRCQWKNYHASEQDVVYRQMDQLGVMIRAQKTGDCVKEGPWVLLERATPEKIAPHRKCKNDFGTSMRSLTFGPRRTGIRMSSASGSTISSFSGSIVKVPRRTQSSSISSRPRAVDRTGLQEANSFQNQVRLSFQNATRKSLSLNPSHNSKGNSKKLRKSPINKLNRKSLSPSVLRHRTSNFKSSERSSPVIRHTRSSVSTQCVTGKMSRPKSIGLPELENHEPTSSSNLHGRNSGSTHHLQEGYSNIFHQQAVVCLPRVAWPAQSFSPKTSRFKIADTDEGVLSQLPTSCVEQTIEVLKREVSDHPIPKWAENLIQVVYNNPSLNQEERRCKIYQILGLLKSYYFHDMKLEPTMRPVVVLNQI